MEDRAGRDDVAEGNKGEILLSGAHVLPQLCGHGYCRFTKQEKLRGAPALGEGTAPAAPSPLMGIGLSTLHT